jgi:hypothetical protein
MIGEVPKSARDIAEYRGIKVDIGVLSPEMDGKWPGSHWKVGRWAEDLENARDIAGYIGGLKWIMEG